MSTRGSGFTGNLECSSSSVVVELQGWRRHDDGPWLVDTGLAMLLPTTDARCDLARAKTVLAVVTRRQGGFLFKFTCCNVRMVLQYLVGISEFFLQSSDPSSVGCSEHMDNSCHLVEKLRIGYGQSRGNCNS